MPAFFFVRLRFVRPRFARLQLHAISTKVFMLESIFNRSLYIRISPERLTIRDPYTGQEFSDIPEVAIVGNPVAKIVAIGSKARAALATTNGKLFNPFDHPRSLVSDFTTAAQLLKIAVRQEFGKPVFRPLPKVVIHPLGSPAGGFTQIERRALSELAFGVGHRKSLSGRAGT